MRARLSALLLLPLALLLGGCGQDVTSHNAADVTFLQASLQQVPAKEIATLLNNSSPNQQTRDIGGAILRSQQTYIEQTEALLAEFGEPIPSYGTDPEVEALKTSTDFEGDAIALLVTRHESLVAAARKENESGENTATIKLARDLITARSSELGQLRALQQGDVRDYGGRAETNGL